RTLDLCLGDEVRTQDAPYVVGTILSSRTGARLAWEFLEQRWAAVTSRFPDNSIPRMLDGIASITDAGLAVAIHAFLDAHPIPQQKLLAQALERLDINVAFAGRVGGELPGALARATSTSTLTSTSTEAGAG
ncbi:MAG: ERAP1-like C-terminal domain-containing protein, partial [Actinomycetota bacterium]|nr:ERAP1-like C-terminal domain-containing protein [Actinomycetota bacterium]